MKPGRLKEILHQKIRIKVTRSRRGVFEVVIRRKGARVIHTTPGKKAALTWLFTHLRCLDEIVIEVRKKTKGKTSDTK